MTELSVQELLDRATLAADTRWAGAAITDLEPLAGGISSLTFAARLDGAGPDSGRVVLKVAPPGLAPVRNRDVLRQARILKALAGLSDVLVPTVMLEDSGAPPGQPPFFVMEFIPGEAYEPKKDVSTRPPTPSIVASRFKAAARMLAHLHTPEPADLGLTGESAVPLEDELDRWALLYSTVDEDLRHAEAELHQRLRETIPAAHPARVVHGDYRIGNIQFVGPELTAVIDWEIWSLGDPRTDLAWLMAYTDPVQRFHLHRDPANQAAGDAVPHMSEVLKEYLSHRAIETAELPWFLAYCYYKIASTTAALAKRNRRRPDPDPALEIAASTIAPVIERGLQIIEAAMVHQ
jgi:aminoglycoside phosphotransferase (APT) family kinase protein